MKLPLEKMLQKKYLFILLAVLLVIAGTGWLLTGKKSTESRYATANVERGSITQTVSANGTLNPVKLVNVGSQVSGIVKKLYVDFNDHVKAGQVLLELDPAHKIGLSSTVYEPDFYAHIVINNNKSDAPQLKREDAICPIT